MQAMGAASGISGMIGSNLEQANSRKNYYDQAVQAEQSIRDVDLQAAQAGEVRAAQLNQAASAIIARRAASGLSQDSPTAQAIEKQMRHEAARAGQVAAASAANQRAGLRAKARMLRQAGYDAGRLLDFKFAIGANPGGHLFTGAMERNLYGSSTPGSTSTGKARGG